MSVFFKSVSIESEGQLADAIECENPVLYIHSRPPIEVYVKLGWLLKALKVYLFYSVEYMRYLSIDVRFESGCVSCSWLRVSLKRQWMRIRFIWY